MPWRNGGGVTFEIAREPQTGTEFAWRLSLALIGQSGPFSNFDGYQRAMALVEGTGCILRGIDTSPVALNVPGDMTVFPGSAAVECELVAGPCYDLNLMVREPGKIVRAKHLQLAGNQNESLSTLHDTAIFCLEGALVCTDTRSGRTITLELHDALILNAAAAGDRPVEWQVQSSGAKAAALICAWRGCPD